MYLHCDPEKLVNRVEVFTGLAANRVCRLKQRKLPPLCIDFSNNVISFLGNPVWPGTELTVNTCDNLDWLRAFGTHLWYLTSPAASISDALNLYEEAFQKETTQFGAYAKAPCPNYIVEDTTATNDSSAEDIFDIRFHLLKLYGNKAHKIESIVVPKTYTNQPLDNKLGWLVSKYFN